MTNPPPPHLPSAQELRRTLAVARGDEPGDLAIIGGRIVDVFNLRVERADIVIAGRWIARIDRPGAPTEPPPRQTIEVDAYLAPGFIDAHMHIESTMLPPSEFVRLASPTGTTSVVADPHEIANVLGARGIRWMINNADALPMNFLWTLSSCVPSCHLESAGASLGPDDLQELFDDPAIAPRVVALAEMMNFPGVVNADEAVIRKVLLGRERRIVDGHAPGVMGNELQAYAAAGISSDHECTCADEARARLALGMRVFMREGSAAKNLADLVDTVTTENMDRFCFCTDDRHPADLRDEGHIDHIVRRAIDLGLDPLIAIRIATLHPAEHYRQPHLGAIAPGRQADLIAFDDLRAPRASVVFHAGRLVARAGSPLEDRRELTTAERQSVRSADTVRLPSNFSREAFRISAKTEGPPPTIRVIGMHPDQLVTDHRTMPATIDTATSTLQADPDRDLLKLAVIERHSASGRIGLAFVTGFAFRDGALASTVGHDAHNLAVVGDNDHDMELAARAVANAGGGQAVATNGRIAAIFPLPIAGLMSDAPADDIIRDQTALLEAARSLGCPHHDPFMPLSFLPLPVIPSLKLTDLGLVDVQRFKLVDVIVHDNPRD